MSEQNGDVNCMSEMKKILFCGIDNAGKTSILHVLKKNYSFLNKLKPTKGIERSTSKILDIDFVLWDLGGQQQYLTKYFEKKEYIFLDLSLLFYIIDMQDEIRFDSVLEYFEKIINVFRENSQFPTVVIFLHKIDPDIKHSENMRLYIKDLKKKIAKITPEFNVIYFETSIFERWSIVTAFSFGIRILSERNVQLVSNYLESWAKYFGANALLLMSRDDIIVGEYSIDDASAKNLAKYLEEMRNLFATSMKPVIVRLNGDLLTFNSLNIGKLEMYLIKYTSNSEITEADFTKDLTIENETGLEKLLVNFFQKL